MEIELDPGETVVAEAGAMNYMEEGIEFTTRMGDGSEAESLVGRLVSAGRRALSGESIFMTHFTNRADRPAKVAFSAPFPGRIVAIDMAEHEEISCQKDAFLCAAYGTEISIALQKRLGTGFFGGEGFVLQRLRGDGMAFVHAGGTVVRRDLVDETLRVDTGCLVAFTPGIEYAIARVGSLRSMFFGGEGFFLATLRGTGSVWLQSLPFARLAERVLQQAPSPAAGGEGGEAGGRGGRRRSER